MAAEQPPPNSNNLVHRLWGRFALDLREALSLAYNQAKRAGKTRISTRTFFAALARLKPASVAQLLGHEVRGDELAEVAQVDRAARRGAGGDGDRVALAGVAYGVVRRPRHPVDRFALLSASCHAGKANGGAH